MSVRYLNFALAVILLLGSSGCLMVDIMQETAHEYKRAMKPSSDTYRDFTEEPEDHSYVGEIARGDRPTEPSPGGKLWSKYLMSEKARDIERNFNIDH